MKKNLILLFLFAITAITFVHAQDFEGTVAWTMKMEVTDPQMKAQMEAADKQMKDPANQAKMKEMEAKMDDPQFKAMLESNPQMKAQIMNMIKAAQGGGGLSAMIPKGMNMKVKGTNSITSMDGGFMAHMSILHKGDKDITYSLDREGKTYSILPKSTDDKTQEKVDVKVTKTSETTKVLGYTCTKYIVKVTPKDPNEKMTAMTQNIWATTEIKGIDFKSLARQRMGNSQQNIFYEQIDGVPLKIDMTMPQGNMEMLVTEIKKQSIASSEFDIPAGYKEVAQPKY
ncbi:DUF4412 domain-containing protein [Chryseolinea lacunae]|uniref:DUF4412 domain-containing protein n=1 Tax=Chryseolinea lacunae TaxID=2801331 RepID=A0ABS1KT49_9BACT|nr:DUF4412 domain-containing protein [Chryseolinea lacunae]MBL0742645.1 DUF4412 domain-containing protein [Chryseolinea lacunae]